MRKYRLCFFVLSLSLICGMLRADSGPDQSNVATLVINNDSEESKDLKHTLEIYPTEIYIGDVVYFASYIENVSDEVRKPHSLMIGNPRITFSQIEKEYQFHANASTEFNVVVRNSVPLQPGEKRLLKIWSLQFPPFEDLEEPFWKELRESTPSEGSVCTLQLTKYYYVQDDSEKPCLHEEALTQDILIKPRSEKESLFLEKQRLKALELQTIRNEKRDGKFVFSPPEEEDGYIALKGKEYAPSHFVGEALGTSLVPDNPKTLDGWRELDASLADGTLRDEISFTRLLLEYFAADEGEKTELAEKELLDWLNALPDVQREFFLRKIVDEGASFFYQTPFADKSRALLRTLYDSLDDNYQLRVYEFEKDVYHATSLVPPQGRYIRPSPDETLEYQSERTAKANASDGWRVWVYYGQVHKEKFAAKFLRFDDMLNQVYLRAQTGELRLDLNRFSRKDQEYILEMRDQ